MHAARVLLGGLSEPRARLVNSQDWSTIGKNPLARDSLFHLKQFAYQFLASTIERDADVDAPFKMGGGMWLGRRAYIIISANRH